MTSLDREPSPSWALPIALSAAVSFLGTVLLQLLASISGATNIAACCCFAPLSFVPFGALPALLALRRDRGLTPGQGFTIAFIGVGLGMVLWAAIAAFSIEPGEVAQATREAYEQVRESGGREELSDEELAALADAAGQLARFVPAIGAAIVTILSGFAGMLTVSFAQRGARNVS